MKKILFIANIPSEDPRSIGGATVLAKNIFEYLKTKDNIVIIHKPLRTHWYKYGQILDYLFWIIKSPFYFYKYDIISIHASNDFHFTISPIIWLWAKLFNKKITYHFFGGVFYEHFKRKNKFHKYIMKKTFLKSDTLFIETKMMLNNFKKEKINNCIWLPNSRKPNIQTEFKTEFNKRFIFISRVTPTKGINELLLASKNLPKDYIIDIYGPLDKKYYNKDYFDRFNVNYKGIIQSDKVTNILSKYDVLLLPTYYEGEGYPGVIIECLSLGIPVISTNWRAIPEIVNSKNGILIEPKSSIELNKAIQHFNKNNYKNYKKEALKSFNEFSSDFVFNKIVKAYMN